MTRAMSEHKMPRLYDEAGDLLMHADQRADRVILLPAGDPRRASPERDRIRIQWGQHMLADLLAGRYRSFVCGLPNGSRVAPPNSVVGVGRQPTT